MKFAIQTLFAIGFTALALNASAGKWSQNNGVVSSDTEIVESTAIESISVEEEHGIIFMREEEKLARDVYTTLYGLWGMNIFNNIAKSEQSHMDAMKVLIDKYALADPNIDDSVGVYSDYHFVETYEELVTLGSESLESALRVGIIIEELDIKDIKEMENEVEGNDDIVSTYEELLKGSRNHLRAFWDVFSSKGLTYEPQFISQEEFDAIINSPMETGNLK
ncbi:DUF2202 domain-containing protein [Thiomicrorhabdus lithotrophica]|uniref:DUF2202 domain-containing protein n=1 Tax=Thiomicrorhabdus lithotrophica TaxID=2949997 RepID=A0ABY8C8S1_9GAMM|nr:DUF2202 domain-containing protein [Thiomicrorhabdus lithotrophica]WEJ62354.1 DUF2202 domain-containing protein [Thiomicrorhabdus lithotrophica]